MSHQQKAWLPSPLDPHWFFLRRSGTGHARLGEDLPLRVQPDGVLQRQKHDLYSEHEPQLVVGKRSTAPLLDASEGKLAGRQQ